MKILFCGDVCPGGVLPYQDKYIDEELLSYMKQFDLRVCTLEGAIGTGFDYEPSKMSANGGHNNINYVRDEDAFRLKEMGFDLVSLANNHAIDLGEAGFKNTIIKLRDLCINYIGAGSNTEEASEPYVIELNSDQTLAFVACCIEGTYPISCTVADSQKAGIYKADITTLVKQIKELKKVHKYVIILPHWGKEHSFLPPEKCKLYATQLIQAGADGIFASHSHTYGPFVKVNRKPVAYAMGNFLFPDFCMEVPRPMYYPSDIEELKKLQKVINYPKSIDQNTISVWDKDSRIGLMYEFETESQNVAYQFVCLSKDNILYKLNDINPELDKKLKGSVMPWGRLCCKYKIANFINRGINKISRI